MLRQICSSRRFFTILVLTLRANMPSENTSACWFVFHLIFVDHTSCFCCPPLFPDAFGAEEDILRSWTHRDNTGSSDVEPSPASCLSFWSCRLFRPQEVLRDRWSEVQIPQRREEGLHGAGRRQQRLYRGRGAQVRKKKNKTNLTEKLKPMEWK